MYTRQQLKQVLYQTARTGAGDPDKDAWANMAIAKMVDACWPRIMDVTFQDLAINGTTQRWALSGLDVALLPQERQLAPQGLTGWAAFTAISWNTNADGSLMLEPGVNADGTAAASTAPVTTISASIAPATALGSNIRVWFARRIAQPQQDTDLVRVDNLAFAHAGALYYYSQLLGLNASATEARDYKSWATFWQAEAMQAYKEAVPPVMTLAQDLPEW